jgi:hypothetical protein
LSPYKHIRRQSETEPLPGDPERNSLAGASRPHLLHWTATVAELDQRRFVQDPHSFFDDPDRIPRTSKTKRNEVKNLISLYFALKNLIG